MSSSSRFNVLDCFRGICALSVVVYHMHYSGSFTEFSFFRGSHWFVEFFFILSGFVMAHAYGQKKNLYFKDFMISRVFRIFPLHVFMLAVFLLLELGKLAASRYGLSFNKQPFTGENAISEILPNMFLVQSWTSFTASQSFNYPSWSISVEFYTYLVFAAVVALLFRFRLAVWAALALASFSIMYFNVDGMMGASLIGLQYFFMGAVSYRIYCEIECRVKLPSELLTVIEAFCIACIVLLVSDGDTSSYLIGGVFCLSTIVFALEKGRLSSFFKLSWLDYLGRLSYSIYMVHAAVLFVVLSLCMVAGKLTGTELSPMIDGARNIDAGSGLISGLLAACVLALVIAVSWLTHRYIELPGQLVGRTIIARRHARTNKEQLSETV